MNKSCPVCTAKTQARGDLSVCSVCTHIFQTDLEVRATYDKKYIQDRYDAYATTSSMSWLRAGFLRAHVPPGRLLDVGYGNGSFVKTVSNFGYEAFGADVHGCDYGVTEHKLASMNEYQAVTFFDSLEHFSDFDQVKHLLGRTAYIMISFPKRPETFPVNLDWKHYRPGEHLHYFSALSIMRLFARFRIVARENIEDAIRGPLPSGEHNIETMVFKRTS